MAVRLSAPRAGRPLPPRKIPGTHFCQRLSKPQGHSAAGRIRSIEKSNDLMGYETRDLAACSVVPQPTTLPRAPTLNGTDIKKLLIYFRTLRIYGLLCINCCTIDSSGAMQRSLYELWIIHSALNLFADCFTTLPVARSRVGKPWLAGQIFGPQT
jgi:hypothetical protein